MTSDLLHLLAEAAPPAPGGAAPASGGSSSTAAPAEAQPAQESKSPFDMGILLPIGLMFAVMYFLMIRPQQRKEKELRAMVDRLKKNDKVWLQGGIYGIVSQVKDKYVIVKIDEDKDVKIKVLKSAVLGVDGKPDGSDKAEAPAPEPESGKPEGKPEADK